VNAIAQGRRWLDEIVSLRELGVGSIGHRRRLLDAIAALSAAPTNVTLPAEELRSEGKKHVHDTKGDGKIGDAESVAPMIEGGRVFYLPDAPGLAAFRDEVIAFPKGKYNYQVDSMVQLLKRASRVVSTAQDTKRPERKGIRFENSRTTITAIPVYADRRLVRY
jgi:hypothetical protein